MKQTITIYAMIFSLIAVLSVAYAYVDKAICLSKWKDSKYTYFSRCLVNVEGVYVPEANVRIIKWENAE